MTPLPNPSITPAMRRSYLTGPRPTKGLAPSLVIGGLILGLVAACGILSPELPFSLPEEDASLDPGSLRVGSFAYPCRTWLGGRRPTESHILVDIFFAVDGGTEVESPADVDRPVLAHRRLVERAGGVVLKGFNLAGMRVWFPTDSIPPLQDSPRYAIVRRVPDPRRYDMTVLVIYGDGTRWPADSANAVALGGRVLIPVELPGPAAAIIAIPNRSLPALRRNPNFTKVFYDGEPLCDF